MFYRILIYQYFIKMQTSWNKDQSLHKWALILAPAWNPSALHCFFQNIDKKNIIHNCAFSSSHFVSTTPAAIQWALIYIAFCTCIFQIWNGTEEIPESWPSISPRKTTVQIFISRCNGTNQRYPDDIST